MSSVHTGQSAGLGEMCAGARPGAVGGASSGGPPSPRVPKGEGCAPAARRRRSRSRARRALLLS
eukprot:scaffold1779_cov373-Prasinococcus_capsulatus_cf.AAC.1